MKNFLDYASSCYYAGNPVITDEEFDRLAEAHGYEYVGASVRDGVPHTFPMYSLKKCYTDQKMIGLGPYETVTTPKLDGAAISLLYVEGVFKLALTRGDGKRGQVITENVRHLVPTSLNQPVPPVVQITGEVVAPKTIPNARNYAAGAMNLKDSNEVKQRDLTFVAYGISPSLNKLWTEDMEVLEQNGFSNVLMGDWEQFPQDGKVVRINENEIFENAGYTSNHPKGAYALKQRSEGVQTRLLDVKWQVGRSGIVSPVAILEPVTVGEAVVSRATLHNMRYIEDLGLEIGCQVEIIRSGEIIPRVVRRV